MDTKKAQVSELPLVLLPRTWDTDAHSDRPAELIETRKSLCRRSIEQIAFIKDVNSLIVLSGASATSSPVCAQTS